MAFPLAISFFVLGDQISLITEQFISLPEEVVQGTRELMLAETPLEWVLAELAFYRMLNCQALRQWYRHMAVYRSVRGSDDPLAAQAAPYLDRSVEQFETRVEMAIRARRRLEERKQDALEAVGLRTD